ncbi:1-acyl-sn-glycerol-3-phosphate acyltransferase [Prauserella sediminis]|uniref:1-acyl-sn-glycerol-3-phosphate acyltransferase n=1 Tax=Prauserella sediminis TaxID=577680 RepID=A0A839XWV3_9PSEU|nr:lysophospholipid acyltransferase family protein [Prauserella sediminis]MBB3665844.1 1-acyl-sn-glycerol-3-phosphate acyltransferase [Prauserella sediminis]
MSHPWMPVSPCGDGCLTPEATRVGAVRRALRLTGAALVVTAGLLLVPVLAIPPCRDRVVRGVFRGLLAALGIRLVVHGELDGSGRGALVVSNHISFADILGLNATRPMRALAKREIASWPVLGTLASRAGTVFLDRERLSALPAAVDALATALRSGALITVNPEGTTWCGSASGRFRPALFQAAIDAGVPVRPVAVRYLAGGRETTRPAFIGPESLIASLRRTVAIPDLTLELTVCPEIAPGRAGDRRELAALADAAVASALGTVTVAGAALRPRGGRPAPVPEPDDGAGASTPSTATAEPAPMPEETAGRSATAPVSRERVSSTAVPRAAVRHRP